MTLTKSEYMMFLKHRAWVWLKKHDKNRLPPVDANTQAMFDAGNKLEKYAELLFPNAERIGFNDYQEYCTLGERTKEAIASGKKVLFQARFDAGELICLTDVVEFTAPSTVNLYEIKSSTKVKPEHEYDLAFQMVVLENYGLTVDTISVIHINNSYVREGNIDPQKLFTTTDITEKVKEKRELTKKHIAQALKIIASPTIPDISPKHCRLGSLQDWMIVYRGLKELPEYSIYDLVGPTAQQIAELEEKEVSLLADIPEDLQMNDRQKRQLQAFQSGEGFVDKEAIQNFIKDLQYPLYFFDYETCSDGIPPFDGVKPYQQVPCQYSLHVMDEPGGDIRHHEYIHRTNDHPGESVAKALQKDIGTTGSVIVWYANFETSRNSELGEHLPEFSEFFKDLNNRTVDLMLPFSEGWYIHPGFAGSASIKKVLPILVPDLSYKDLVVQEGQSAQRLWMKAVLEGEGSQVDREQLFLDLCSYCELDTLAMVKIYEKLLELIAE